MNLHIPPDLTLISQLHARATAATLAAAHRTPHAGSKLCVRATALLLLLLISSLVAGRLANLQLHFTSRLLPGRLHISHASHCCSSQGLARLPACHTCLLNQLPDSQEATPPA
jgi:hypothetical protein